MCSNLDRTGQSHTVNRPRTTELGLDSAPVRIPDSPRHEVRLHSYSSIYHNLQVEERKSGFGEAEKTNPSNNANSHVEPFRCELGYEEPCEKSSFSTPPQRPRAPTTKVGWERKRRQEQKGRGKRILLLPLLFHSSFSFPSTFFSFPFFPSFFLPIFFSF